MDEVTSETFKNFTFLTKTLLFQIHCRIKICVLPVSRLLDRERPCLPLRRLRVRRLVEGFFDEF